MFWKRTEFLVFSLLVLIFPHAWNIDGPIETKANIWSINLTKTYIMQWVLWVQTHNFLTPFSFSFGFVYVILSREYVFWTILKNPFHSVHHFQKKRKKDPTSNSKFRKASRKYSGGFMIGKWEKLLLCVLSSHFHSASGIGDGRVG